MTQKPVIRWAVLKRTSAKSIDGATEHFVWNYEVPWLFLTRRSARSHIEASYGYIRGRKDLREYPHGCLMPVPVKVRVILERVVE